MNLGAVALQIRAANTRFLNRVVGAAELALALEYPLQDETAFVIQVADSAPANQNDSSINQGMIERIGIICALKNDTSKKDILGFEAYSLVDTVRSQLFTALLGWTPVGAEGMMYYAGGRIISLNTAWLWYQFEFEATTRLQEQYDPGAGALPYLQQVFAQYKLNGDVVLPLPDTESLPTTLLTDPVLEELLELPGDFSTADYGATDVDTAQARLDKITGG